MTVPIDNATSGVSPQLRIAQIRSRFDGAPSPTAATSPSGVARAQSLFSSDGANQASDKLATLADSLGIDKAALMSALKSGDPTQLTNLITTSSLSALSGDESSDSAAGLDGGSDGTSGIGGDSSDLQSKLASMGRTGLQFNGLL